MTRENPILSTDSYKASHYLQYPPGAEIVSSYIESRGGRFDETVFFGLQVYLKHLAETHVTPEDVAEADALFAAHGVPFNRDGWAYIVDRHEGRLPIRIEAVPEGTVMPLGNVLLQAENTDPALPWLTSYMETALLRAVWYPTTVASLSRAAKKVIYRALAETSEDPDGQIPFKLHDFGARGVSSRESAVLGGMAHLVNFQGTDTVEALIGARRYYGEPMAGFSIPASEHSTITAWGQDRETDAYANMLAQFGGPGKTVACVSDSYDIYNAVEHIWGDVLKQDVEEAGGTLVVRPDSGDPATVVVRCIELLMARFGHSTNGKGYRVLPDCVRVIQGDGVDIDSIGQILADMKAAGQSADNIAFGMGGGLLQKVDRDTLKFAMKASAIRVGGIWQDVFKDPVTDQGKRSKRGRLALVSEGTDMETVRLDALGERENRLRPVFENGRLLEETSFADIRARAATWLRLAERPTM